MSNPRPTKRLLIIDDEPDLRELLVDEFKRRGWDTFEADDGQSALRFIEENQADVVVSDIRMPRLSGIDLLKRVQAMQGVRRPPIILITGYSDISANDAKALGAAAVLMKPFDLLLLVQEVEKHAPKRE